MEHAAGYEALKNWKGPPSKVKTNMEENFSKWKRVANPHHFNADPDPAFHYNADPDPDPAHHQKCSSAQVYETSRAPFWASRPPFLVSKASDPYSWMWRTMIKKNHLGAAEDILSAGCGGSGVRRFLSVLSRKLADMERRARSATELRRLWAGESEARALISSARRIRFRFLVVAPPSGFMRETNFSGN